MAIRSALSDESKLVGIEYESIVDHPLDEVFAWHTHPGAMPRLVPPWQPMTVVAETDSLADGRAVLGLPGGLRWVAQHDPQAYAPPHRFVDELSSDGLRSWPPRLVGHWRQTHDFEDVPGGRTLVRDRVDVPLPAAALRSTFVYRHRQLADDLAAHQDAALCGPRPLVIAVTGATGLIGSQLTALLPVPSLGPRLLLGEQGVRELAEANQRVLPVKLQTLEHRFRQPQLYDALAHQLGHG